MKNVGPAPLPTLQNGNAFQLGVMVTLGLIGALDDVSFELRQRFS